jgi:glycosyltransferase 2 family protein
MASLQQQMHIFPSTQMSADPRAPQPDTQYKLDRLIRSVLIFALVGTLLYGAATVLSDYKVIGAALWSFPPQFLLMVIALVLAGWFLRGWRFHYYMVGIGAAVPFGYSLAVFLAGFALTGTPGKVGEGVKGVFLKEDYGTPFTSVMGVLVIERLMDLFGVLALASFSLLLFKGWETIFFLCAGIIVCGGIVLTYDRLYLPVLKLFGRIGFLSKIVEKIIVMLETGRNLMTPRIFILGLLLSVCSWGMESVSLYIIMKGLSLPGEMLQANFVYSFSTLLGALSMLPGGVGGTEAGMVGLFKFLGISYSEGLPAVILIRLTTLWFAIFTGLLFMGLMLARSRNR